MLNSVLSALIPPWNTVQPPQIADKTWALEDPPPQAEVQERSDGCLIELFSGAAGNMQACNYNFALHNSHSSDLNVFANCERKRQHFDELLPLHLERERERERKEKKEKKNYSFTPEESSQPPSCPLCLTLAAGMPYQAGDKNKEPE